MVLNTIWQSEGGVTGLCPTHPLGGTNMRRFLPVRLLAVAALAAPASLAVLALPGTAYAGTDSVVCTQASGTETGVITLSGCTDPSLTGGTGTNGTGVGSSNIVASTSSTVWGASSHLTSLGTFKYKLYASGSKKDKCPTGQSEIVEKSKVGKKTVANGGTAETLWGQKGVASLCLNTTTSTLSLLAGTTYSA